jgi:hypothetical protein
VDFSDIGGVPVGNASAAQSGAQGPDFSDLGGKPVQEDEGALMAAGRGALRNFPLAQQAVAGGESLLGSGKYAENIADLTQKAEAAKAAHPIAYGTGAVAGTAAPLLIPGVGEALEAAPIAGNAALGAVQSLSDTNLKAPTASDVKSAAISGLLGGGVGAIGKGISALAPSAENLAAESTAQGIGTTARKLLPIIGKDPEGELSQIGEWLNTADEGKSLVGLADRPGQLLEKVQGVHDVAGKQIGDIIDKIAPDVPIGNTSIINDLKPIAEELNIVSPDSEKKVLNLAQRINDLANDGKLTFDKLYELKGVAWKAAKKDENVIPAFGVLTDYINKIVDAYGEQIGDPALKASYDAAKYNYHNASKLLPILKYAEAKELAGGPVGKAGLTGIGAVLAGLASGHPVAGLAGGLGTKILAPTAERLSRNAMLKAAPYLPQLAKILPRMGSGAAMELSNALSKMYQSQGGKQ